MVLGHTNCGAVKASCDNFTGGHITEISKMITPAVSYETTVIDNRRSVNDEFVRKVCDLNVGVQIDVILKRSNILRELLTKEKIGIVGGIYDLTTTGVSFPEHYKIFNASHRESFNARYSFVL
jgi:carbonic anhydrase